MKSLAFAILLLGGTALFAPDGLAQGQPSTAARPTMPAPATDTFLTKVAAGNTFEIESSKLALSRSRNAEVKAFAQMMIDMHTRTTADLKAAIAESGQPLVPPTALPDDLQAKLDNLGKAADADFANMMIKDHGEAGAKFKKAVADAKLKAPPDEMDAKHKKLQEDLAKKNGADFEKSYIAAQRDGHKETVELFEAYAAGGDNARMKQFAQELLPTLRKHLEHVAKLN